MARTGNKKASGAKGVTSSSTSTPATPPEKYVVIITNVENDFAKVHQDSLGAFCCLDPRRNRHPLPPTPSDAEALREKGTCSYDITCRTETRSAEIKFYGKADADVSTVFVRGNKKTSPKAAAANATTSLVTSHDDVDAEDPTATSTDALEVEEVLTKTTTATSRSSFQSLEDMVAVLQHRPYFTHPPTFHLTLPGKEEGEVITSAMAEQARTRKRQREEEEENKKTKDNSKESGDEAHSASKAKKRPDVEEEEEEKEEEGTPSTTRKDAQATKQKKPAGGRGDVSDPQLRQFGHTQKELVSAVASVSAHWTTKQLREHLADLPGFLTCWMLFPQRFRVVFHTAESLFKAKQLLDQFVLEGDVRVSLSLAEGLAQQRMEFLAAQEANEPGSS